MADPFGEVLSAVAQRLILGDAKEQADVRGLSASLIGKQLEAGMPVDRKTIEPLWGPVVAGAIEGYQKTPEYQSHAANKAVQRDIASGIRGFLEAPNFSASMSPEAAALSSLAGSATGVPPVSAPPSVPAASASEFGLNYGAAPGAGAPRTAPGRVGAMMRAQAPAPTSATVPGLTPAQATEGINPRVSGGNIPPALGNAGFVDSVSPATPAQVRERAQTLSAWQLELISPGSGALATQERGQNVQMRGQDIQVTEGAANRAQSERESLARQLTAANEIELNKALSKETTFRSVFSALSEGYGQDLSAGQLTSAARLISQDKPLPDVLASKLHAVKAGKSGVLGDGFKFSDMLTATKARDTIVAERVALSKAVRNRDVFRTEEEQRAVDDSYVSRVLSAEQNIALSMGIASTPAYLAKKLEDSGLLFSSGQESVQFKNLPPERRTDIIDRFVRSAGGGGAQAASALDPSLQGMIDRALGNALPTSAASAAAAPAAGGARTLALGGGGSAPVVTPTPGLPPSNLPPPIPPPHVGSVAQPQRRRPGVAGEQLQRR